MSKELIERLRDEVWRTAELDMMHMDAAELIEKQQKRIDDLEKQLNEKLLSLKSLLPDERDCCGTFPRTPHRSNCKHYRGKKGSTA